MWHLDNDLWKFINYGAWCPRCFHKHKVTHREYRAFIKKAAQVALELGSHRFFFDLQQKLSNLLTRSNERGWETERTRYTPEAQEARGRLWRLLEVCAIVPMPPMRKTLLHAYSVLKERRWTHEAVKALEGIGAIDAQLPKYMDQELWLPLLQEEPYALRVMWILTELDFEYVATPLELLFESAVERQWWRGIILGDIARQTNGEFCQLMGEFFRRRPDLLAKHESDLKWAMGSVLFAYSVEEAGAQKAG